MLTEHGIQIAPRTFYAWASRAPSKRSLWDAAITEVLAGFYEPDARRPPPARVVVRVGEDVGPQCRGLSDRELHEPGLLGAGSFPSDDRPGVGVDDECDLDEHPGDEFDVGEVICRSSEYAAMAMATFDGVIYGVGQLERPFSIQSVSKLFALALLLAEIGDRVWQGVGREPSGNPFNSLVQLESERGIPRNPFINAGALVVTDRLLSATGDAAGAVREFLRTESGNPKLDTDRVVARSEAEQGHRNAALAHFIASYGNLENPVDWVLDHYYAHCAIEASCRDLALAGLFLSKHGLRVDGRRLLGRTDAKRMNAVMLTCGTYDAAGEFAYRVGLPAKSGAAGPCWP